jgi:DNA-directed RNA polymerase subunit RPC12/RpoP
MAIYRCNSCGKALEEIGVPPQIQALQMYKQVVNMGSEQVPEEIKNDPFVYRGFYCSACNKVFCPRCSNMQGEICPACKQRRLMPAYRPLLKKLNASSTSSTVSERWPIKVPAATGDGPTLEAAPQPGIAPSVGGHQLEPFPVAVAILLHFITLAIFSFFHFNLMHGKLPKVRPDDPSAGKAIGFMFIPFYNFYWVFFCFNRLCLRVDEQRTQRGLPPSNLRGLSIAMCVTMIIPYINFLFCWPILAPIFFGMMRSSVNELVSSEIFSVQAKDPQVGSLLNGVNVGVGSSTIGPTSMNPPRLPPHPARSSSTITATKVLVLAHFLGRSEFRFHPRPGVQESWKETFRVQPLIVQRPKRGKVSYAVQCRQCGKRMDVSVTSSGACRFKRAIIAGVLGLVSIAVPILLLLFIPALICVFFPPGLTEGVSLRSDGSGHEHTIKRMVNGKLR